MPDSKEDCLIRFATYPPANPDAIAKIRHSETSKAAPPLRRVRRALCLGRTVCAGGTAYVAGVGGIIGIGGAGG